MSREIKFRAWFIPTQNIKRIFLISMVENWMTYMQNYMTDDFLDDTWVYTGNYEEPIIFEQYTGLKDKNDKEIYEGDIISETSDLGEDFDYHFKYNVYWNEDNLCWSVKCIDGYSWHDDLWECNGNIEVIGNIHENPELVGEHGLQ